MHTFLPSLVLLLSSASYAVPTKQKLLVIHSAYCGHCQKWIEEISNNFKQQAKDHGIEKVPDLKLYDVTETEGQNLIEIMTKEKALVRPVNAVPAFVVLDKNGNEKEHCRMAGYADKEKWFSDAKAMLERCAD